MLRPLELFIGLRYLRAKRESSFVSFITFASLLGIAVGVAALIVVLSVMNGFEGELRTRLLSMTAHATISSPDGLLRDWRPILERSVVSQGVGSAAPYVEFQAMLANGGDLSAVLIRGVDPEYENNVSGLGSTLQSGSIEDLQPGSHNIVVGYVLALKLGVIAGDKINLLVPRIRNGEIMPLLRRYTVSGVFDAGVQEHDANLAFIHFDDAAVLEGEPGAATGIRLRYEDIFDAPVFSQRLVESLNTDLDRALVQSDWSKENASYFRAIRIEKTMMTIILMLIVAVAAFNIVATLIMVVTDKRTDIAILRTLGLTPASIVAVFMILGVAIGWAGTALGVILGVLLALNVGTIVPKIEALFGFQIMPGDVYYITELPSILDLPQTTLIAVLAFLLTVIATIYPARRAASTHPAEALRYD